MLWNGKKFFSSLKKGDSHLQYIVQVYTTHNSSVFIILRSGFEVYISPFFIWHRWYNASESFGFVVTDVYVFIHIFIFHATRFGCVCVYEWVKFSMTYKNPPSQTQIYIYMKL